MNRYLGSLLLLLLAETAHAFPAMYSLEGLVEHVYGSSPFVVGDVVSGSYTFESTTTASPDGGINQGFFQFNNAISAFQFSVRGYSASANSGNIEVASPMDNTNYYLATSHNNFAANSPLVTKEFSLIGFDNSESLFNGVQSLPPDLSLSDFSSSLLFAVFILPNGDNTSFTGRLTSFAKVTQPTSIPEPTSLALMSLGLVGFGFMRRR